MSPPPGDAAGLGRADAEAELDALRERISRLDEELVRLVGERRAVVLEIGRAKERLGMPVLDPAREAEVVRRAAGLARAEGVDEELVRDVIWRIVASARQSQEGRTSWGPPERSSPEPAAGGAEGDRAPDPEPDGPPDRPGGEAGPEGPDERRGPTR